MMVYKGTVKCANLRQAGISLLELLITLLISIVIGGAAFPNFSLFVSANSLENRAQELFIELQHGRYHAISHSVNVMLCPIKGDSCGDAVDWTRGWILFVDKDKNKKFDPETEELLSKRSWIAKTNSGSNMSLSFRKNQAYTYFKPDGTAWPNGTFRLCSTTQPSASSAVVLSMSGRARIASSSEAIHRCG